jgi:hypothetical protein
MAPATRVPYLQAMERCPALLLTMAIWRAGRFCRRVLQRGCWAAGRAWMTPLIALYLPALQRNIPVPPSQIHDTGSRRPPFFNLVIVVDCTLSKLHFSCPRVPPRCTGAPVKKHRRPPRPRPAVAHAAVPDLRPVLPTWVGGCVYRVRPGRGTAPLVISVQWQR